MRLFTGAGQIPQRPTSASQTPVTDIARRAADFQAKAPTPPAV